MGKDILIFQMKFLPAVLKRLGLQLWTFSEIFIFFLNQL